MEQTEVPGLKLVNKDENGCCGGTTCDEAAAKAAYCAQTAKTEVTKEMLIANVLELSMLVNRLNTEIGTMAKGVQGMVAEMYQAMMKEIEALKQSINPQ